MVFSPALERADRAPLLRTHGEFVMIARAAVLLLAAAILPCAVAAPLRAQPPGGAPGGPAAARSMPPARTTVELVARFDADGNGWLNVTERAAARAWLESSRAAGGTNPASGMPRDEARSGGAPPAGPPPGAAQGGAGGAAPPPVRRAGRPLAPSSPGARLTSADVRSYPADVPLYDAGALRTLFIEFENRTDWEAEVAAFDGTDVEVPATITVDGTAYDGVGVRFRGASSFRMVPAGSKRSLNLGFDFVHEGQALGGYRTLNLLNAYSDPTFVRALLYSAIARDYLPAPKANYVRVVINGESWGVYVNAQQFNRDFLQEFYGAPGGARWKVPGSPNGRGGMEYLGEDVDAYRRLYEIRSRDDPARWADLIGLFRVLNETPVDRLEAALAPILDVDGALRFLAVEAALVNTDGFWSRASDYNIYQSPDRRFHVIPHDMNEALGAANGRFDLDPLVNADDATKALRSRLLAVPALRERYLGYVREIAEEWLTWDRLGPIVEAHQALVVEDVRTDSRKLYDFESFETSTAEMRGWIEQRRAFLLR
jgi:spore coat protein CotH